MNTILATVITCPQRWEHYCRFLQNLEETGLEMPVRTFVQKQYAGDAFANNNLNARAALAYGLKHLPDDGWMLYLEDDVLIAPALAKLLPELVRVGQAEEVDCWYLCNRKNNFWRRFAFGGAVVNELVYPVYGAHALLIPKRHLGTMLAAHWGQVSDLSMFAAINHPGLKVWQVVQPVLVEHVGTVSTYAPEREAQKLEVNA